MLRLIRFAVLALATMIPMLSHAELTLEEEAAVKWLKDRSSKIKEFSDEGKKVISEFSDQTKGRAVRSEDTALLKEKFSAIGKRVIDFMESTNFDAKSRFNKNPLCAQGIHKFQPVLDKLKKGETSVFAALFGYNHSVLLSCALTPKAADAFQELEEIKKSKAQE